MDSESDFIIYCTHCGTGIRVNYSDSCPVCSGKNKRRNENELQN